VDSHAALLIAAMVAFSLYVIGIGVTTATAIRVREVWRHRTLDAKAMAPRGEGEVVLSAPALPPAARRLRAVGWVAFVPALVLALVSNLRYPWVTPVVVVVMVALNAFYFTSIQNMGEQLTLAPDGFRIGGRGAQRSIRWIHVTELIGARVGAFGGTRMSEAGEWQDTNLKPNVIFFRLNRALVGTRKTLLQRLSGFSYYDGVIRNAFGLPTDQLLQVMRDWQRRALDEAGLPLRRARPGPGATPRP
jgi:hypothetical protein